MSWRHSTSWSIKQVPHPRHLEVHVGLVSSQDFGEGVQFKDGVAVMTETAITSEVTNTVKTVMAAPLSCTL